MMKLFYFAQRIDFLIPLTTTLFVIVFSNRDLQIYRPKSMEALVSRERSNPPSRRQSMENLSQPIRSSQNQMGLARTSRKPQNLVMSSDGDDNGEDDDDLTSEDGSDEVWRPSVSNESLPDEAVNNHVSRRYVPPNPFLLFLYVLPFFREKIQKSTKSYRCTNILQLTEDS